ncbi:fimbria/pilus periplasmic chaperone [Escherichia coli]
MKKSFIITPPLFVSEPEKRKYLGIILHRSTAGGDRESCSG